MRISDWSSDVCSSDLKDPEKSKRHRAGLRLRRIGERRRALGRPVLPAVVGHGEEESDRDPLAGGRLRQSGRPDPEEGFGRDGELPSVLWLAAIDGRPAGGSWTMP